MKVLQEVSFTSIGIASTVFLVFTVVLEAQNSQTSSMPRIPADSDSAYLLGAGDQLSIWILGVDESPRPISIDLDGFVDVPMAGRIKAAGLSLDELRRQIEQKLRFYIRDPRCSITVSDFRSQSVSIIGSVKQPGTRELQGNRRLVEAISLAGGVSPDAGPTIRITRPSGPLPVPGAVTDEKTGSTTADISIAELMSGAKPQLDIDIRAGDVISVARARMVYVLGEVGKPGMYMLDEHPGISVLQVLAMAGGFTRGASPAHARILRVASGSKERQEVAIDLRHVLDGKSADVSLTPDDILFVPNSLAKNASLRAIEASIQIGTGILIWNRP